MTITTTPSTPNSNITSFDVKGCAVTYDVQERLFTVNLFGGQFISPNFSSIIYLIDHAVRNSKPPKG